MRCTTASRIGAPENGVLRNYTSSSSGLEAQTGELQHFTVFITYFVLFSYESISWDVQDIDNRQGFLADSPIRAVSMTALDEYTQK